MKPRMDRCLGAFEEAEVASDGSTAVSELVAEEENDDDDADADADDEADMFGFIGNCSSGNKVACD